MSFFLLIQIIFHIWSTVGTANDWITRTLRLYLWNGKEEQRALSPRLISEVCLKSGVLTYIWAGRLCVISAIKSKI